MQLQAIERTVVLPELQSFIIKQFELKNNQGVIHQHSDKYELNFIVDAVGRRFVSGNIANFSPGDLVFMAPGVPHCWEIDNKCDEPKAITIHFKDEFLDILMNCIPELGFLKDLLNKSRCGLHLKIYDQKKLEQLFDRLMKYDSPFDSYLGVLEILRFISLIKDTETLEVSDLNLNIIDLPQNHRLRKVYEYVFFNFKYNIKLSEVAAQISISESAFCSFFKKSTKKTFSQFIKEVRIGYACKLLGENNDKSISQICFESGYNNLANFNRQFKDITGTNPKTYRTRFIPRITI